MTPALQDLADQGGLVDRDWLSTPHEGVLRLDDVIVDQVRDFLMARWIDRAVERGLPSPADLSSSCKFGALLAKCLFGGEIRGFHGHLHVLVDGRILDFSSDAADVRELAEPYLHDEAFLAEPELEESLMSCVPRVTEWVEVLLPSLTPGGFPGAPR